MMKKKQAVALEYDKENTEGAPKVVAVGQGQLAEKIVALARENGVPVFEDIELVEKLVRIPPGLEIPPQLYEAVARVLAFLYRLEAEKRK